MQYALIKFTVNFGLLAKKTLTLKPIANQYRNYDETTQTVFNVNLDGLGIEQRSNKTVPPCPRIRAEKVFLE